MVALLALTASCYTPINWREADVGDVAFEDVWTAFREIAEVDGYPLDAAQSDRGRMVFTSRWRTRPMPFRRSSRRRVHANFESTDAGGWLVRYYIEQQVVEDIARAFEPAEDDWKAQGQDGDTEERFAAKLRMRFPHAAVVGTDSR